MASASKVLLVEDHAILREALSMALGAAGFAAVAVAHRAGWRG